MPVTLCSACLGGGDEIAVLLEGLVSHLEEELPALRSVSVQFVLPEDMGYVDEAKTVLGNRFRGLEFPSHV
jgi:hypothetical protein